MALMHPVARVALLYCSVDEAAAIRNRLASWSAEIVAGDPRAVDPSCDIAIIGSFAVSRRAVLAALRENLQVPAVLLVGSAAEDPNLPDDFALLTSTELHQLPYVIRREVRLHRTEVALRASEWRYRDLIDRAQEGAWVFDAGGTTTLANRKLAALLGTDVDALIGTSIFDFMDEEMRAIARQYMHRRRIGISETHDFRFLRNDGTSFWAMVSASPLYDEAGGYTGALWLVTDISARKNIEEELVRRDLQLSVAQQLANLGHWEWDLVTGDIIGSREVYRIFGVSPMSPRTKLDQWLECVHPDDVDELRKALRDAHENRTRLEAHFRVIGPNGEEFHIDSRAQLVFDDDGKPARMIGMAQDVTERKLNERALRESEERYRLLVDYIPDAIWRADANGHTIFLSDNIEKIWGYTKEEVGADFQLWARRVHPADKERVWTSYRGLFERERPHEAEYRFQRKDGKWVWIHNHGVTVERDGKRESFGVLSDVTARKVEEEARIAAERKFRTLVEQATDIIFTIDRAGTITSLNPAFEITTGWKPEEWIGRHFEELLDRSCVEAARDHFNAIVTSDERYFADYLLRTQDGRLVTIETTAQSLIIEGESVGTLGIARDVTLRRKVEAELEKEKRLASLGHLATSVAHEFNNVLMSIMPFAELLKRRVPNDDRVEMATKHIFQAIRRGRQVSQEILRLGRPAPPSLAPTSVRAWFDDFAREAAAMLGPRYELTTTLPVDEELFILADRPLLDQVAANLVLNARDAMPDGGAIELEARRATDPADARRIELCVRDRGPGISPEILERVFEPLFTTKPSGTGLGLSIAYQAMQQQDGRLCAESTPGLGTTFSMLFREGTVPAPAGKPVARSPHVALRRVVVVEDDEAVGEGIRALLTDEGFDVDLVARGGLAEEAVTRFSPDVVLLDVNLPDMSGLDVYENLSRRWPRLPVIFSTGHADAHALEDVRSRPAPSIMKPYDIQELIAVFAALPVAG